MHAHIIIYDCILISNKVFSNADKSIMNSEDSEWYFFCPVAKKYSYGRRMNRSTEVGYWKATGRDRTILHNSQSIGMMKVLVFHLGRPLQGNRTDWVMHEFRLHNDDLSHKRMAQVIL